MAADLHHIEEIGEYTRAQLVSNLDILQSSIESDNLLFSWKDATGDYHVGAEQKLEDGVGDNIFNDVTLENLTVNQDVDITGTLTVGVLSVSSIDDLTINNTLTLSGFTDKAIPVSASGVLTDYGADLWYDTSLSILHSSLYAIETSAASTQVLYAAISGSNTIMTGSATLTFDGAKLTIASATEQLRLTGTTGGIAFTAADGHGKITSVGSATKLLLQGVGQFLGIAYSAVVDIPTGEYCTAIRGGLRTLVVSGGHNFRADYDADNYGTVIADSRGNLRIDVSHSGSTPDCGLGLGSIPEVGEPAHSLRILGNTRTDGVFNCAGNAGANASVAVAKVGGGTRTLNFYGGIYKDYTDS